MHGDLIHLECMLVKSIQDSWEPWARGEEHGPAWTDVVMVLMWSMEKGRGGETVKYGTARKAHAILTILWESSPSGGNDMTLSAGLVKGRFVATRFPSEEQWYQHFEMGICAQMGDIMTQDSKIGHIPLRFYSPSSKCMMEIGRSIISACHLYPSVHACLF